MENEFNNELGFGMQPMGIATLGPEPVFIPDARTIAQNIIKQKALDTIGRKVGLPALGRVMGFDPLLSSTLGLSALGPVGLGIGALQNVNNRLQSSTFGRSATISSYLANKRAEKAAKRDFERDKQGDVRTVPARIMNIQPTAQDTARGQGGGGGGGNYGMPGRAATGYQDL